jgi:hypothetical protein
VATVMVAQRWGTTGTTRTRGRRVGRGAARGHPGACGGCRGADTAGGGPSAWRRSHDEEDSAHVAAFGVALRTTAQHGQVA